MRRYVWNPSARGGHRSLAAVRLGGGTGASASPPARFAVVDANAMAWEWTNGVISDAIMQTINYHDRPRFWSRPRGIVMYGYLSVW